jgi:hypothetical protein
MQDGGKVVKATLSSLTLTPSRSVHMDHLKVVSLTRQNVTGPGRPGREEETALTGMAAEPLGWDYPTFIENLLNQARLVEDVVKAA